MFKSEKGLKNMHPRRVSKTMWSPLAVFLFSFVCVPHGGLAVPTRHGPAPPGPPPPLGPPPKPSGPSRTVPWQVMVSLTDEDGNPGGYGGGTLIGDRWVLTSGRNLFLKKGRQDTQGQQPLIPKIYLGVAKFEDANPNKEAAVEAVLLHPGFQNVSDWQHDLALIKLKEPVVFNQNLMPIPLPEQDDQEKQPGAIAIFGAWDSGIIHFLPSDIKYLKLPVVALDVCQAEYGPHGSLKVDAVHMFCTGPNEAYMNVCFNDAGSSLVFQNPKSGQVYLGGIVSVDKVCAMRKYPIHTRVAAYLPWIRTVMRGDGDVAAHREALVADLYSRKI